MSAFFYTLENDIEQLSLQSQTLIITILKSMDPKVGYLYLKRLFLFLVSIPNHFQEIIDCFFSLEPLYRLDPAMKEKISRIQDYFNKLKILSQTPRQSQDV